MTAPEVRAVSFVGSTPVAKIVWETSALAHKRVQALGGAKNYNIVMPDCAVEPTLDAVIGSTFGCAGERCMASSVLMLVGEAAGLLETIVQRAAAVKMGNPLDPATEMGPLITKAHKEKVESYVQMAIDDGAKVLLDGRGATVPGHEGGFYMGTTIVDGVTPDMRVAREEIFGPVLCVMRADTLAEAIDMANTSPFGNGGSIFTNSGGAARQFRTGIACGMLGINAGVPAPMAFLSFGGHKDSIFGDLRAHGPDGIEFYTQKKTVIERWFGIGKTGSVWGK
jgi:malonate-semialdehyde dehydrogenase (acetylating)/methylmalonate-semialdehyde dehydrogenase